MQIYNIVLTGGISGGKSAGVVFFKQKLEERGYNVITVPDTTQLLVNMGRSPADVGEESFILFQENILRVQLAMERAAYALAAFSKKDTVILYDRGLVDGKSYSADYFVWQKVIQNIVDFHYEGFDSYVTDHYTGVVHMVTYPSACTFVDRPELKDAAIAQDNRLIQAWTELLGESVHVIENNGGSFKAKLCRALAAIYTIVGVKGQTEIERKYLVTNVEDHLEATKEIQFITQTYLINSTEVEERVRAIGDADYKTVNYFHTFKWGKGMSRTEYETVITLSEYESLLARKDKSRQTIYKCRYKLEFDDMHFDLDFYSDASWMFANKQNIIILEIEVKDPDQEIVFPPFLTIKREVTGEPEFTNYGLSKK